MHIRRRSWHARIYLWWYEHKYQSRDINEKTNVNLCPYMRTILFWAPLRLIFCDWVLGNYCLVSWLTMAVVVPKLLGYVNYNSKIIFWIIEGTIVGGALLILTIYGLASLFNFLFPSKHRRELAESWQASEFVKSAREFGQLLREYGRATHDRICPELRLQ